MTLGLSLPVEGQDRAVLTPRNVAELRRELDELVPRYERFAEQQRAEARAREERLSRRAQGRIDTLTVSGLQIVAWREDRAEIEGSVRRAVDRLAEEFGSAALERAFDGAVFSSSLSSDRPPFGYTQHRTYRFTLPPSGAERAHALDRLLRQIMRDALPESVARWYGPRPLSLDRIRRPAHRGVMLSPSPAVQRCRDRDLDSCRWGLGIGPLGQDPALASMVARWWTPEQTRAHVERLSGLRRGSGAARRCLDEGTGCAEALAETWDDVLYAPVDRTVRGDLLAAAVEAGGQAGLVRLFTLPAETPVADALEAASGRSMDALLSAWLDDIRAAKESDLPAERRGRRTAYAWMILFAGLAMTSTRRRAER